MAHNRNPLKISRTRRQLRTSSSGRAARSKASAKDTPRPTSSTTRAKQQGKGSSKVTTGKGVSNTKVSQGPRSAPVQGPYKKPPKSFAFDSGTVPKAKVPTPGTTNLTRFKGAKNAKNAKKVSKLVRGGAAVLKGDVAMIAATAAEMALSKINESKRSTPHNVGGPKKGSKNPGMSKAAVKAAQAGAKAANANKTKLKRKPAAKSKAQQFDSAFAAARKAGKSVFTWNGKKYTTKLK